MKVLAPDLAKLADFHLALSTAEHGSESLVRAFEVHASVSATADEGFCHKADLGLSDWDGRQR
jgi:hypothetical protein